MKVQNATWREQKKHLVERGRLHQVFLDHEIKTFPPESKLSFEPLLLARHVQRLADLIEKCLSIRKDIRELEILAVKAETDYELFENTSKLDEQIDILRLQIPAKSKDETGYKNATTAFSANNSLEKGLVEIAIGREASLRAEVNDSVAITGLIKERWASIRQYQDNYHKRHSEKGNAHNFGQRAELLLTVFESHVGEALARAKAFVAGINQIYGTILSGMPDKVSLQSLDIFAEWVLKNLQRLAVAGEQEAISEVVIPLVQPWLSSQKSLIDSQVFTSAVSNAKGNPVTLKFSFPSSSIMDPRARLKGIGLSFGNKFNPTSVGIDRNQSADLYTRLLVKVKTPEQKSENGRKYFRPAVVLGNVGLHGAGAPMAMADGVNVENISPFGEWEIEIHPLAVWKDAGARTIDSTEYSDQIKDLKLTLRVYVPASIPAIE